ncbi:neocarzinostatin apoprotein domain-containing protein [Streptomyces sp. NPDC002138]|uniref:neocarzinostatin apoprotein domain-containing protein n=1 Tax=Streptomyces sp. NPDC002138 TaxID=3154410 RepID=UPI00332E0781
MPGTLVSVDRRDGRTAQFQLFRDATAAGGPASVRHREQVAPDGAYGRWEPVGAVAADATGGRLAVTQNAAGGLELLFSAAGSRCRTVQDAGAGGWSPATAVGPAPPAAEGGIRPRSAPAPRTGTAGGPRLTVRDTTGLLDGDIVTFGIKDGPPKAYVWVKQCGPSASATTCDDATGRQFRVYPDGTYQLSPKKLYALLDTPAGTVDCRTAPAGNPCSLALTDNDGALLTTVPLRFRPGGPEEDRPTLRVDPDEGLTEGQTVHVTGKGYEPQYHSLVMECATGSADTLGCRPRARPPATTDKGRLDESVTLSETFTGIDGRAVDCRVRKACELVVFGTRVRGPEALRHPLAFAPSAAAP